MGRKSSLERLQTMVQTPDRQQVAQPMVPPLENGDRLSRDEFERRYAVMPEGCRAELIEGIVFMASALRLKSHGLPHSWLNAWLTNYQIATVGTIVGDAVTVRMDMKNEPQPDLALLIDPDCGGQTQLTEDDYIAGAPEFLAEVAASMVSIDLGSKKTAYERNSVQEYLVWRVLDAQVDWFRLEEGRYVDAVADADGITRSQFFPGLWLDRIALLQGNMPRVLAVLQEGIASTEHGEFVAGLSESVFS